MKYLVWVMNSELWIRLKNQFVDIFSLFLLSSFPGIRVNNTLPISGNLNIKKYINFFLINKIHLYEMNITIGVWFMLWSIVE